MIVTSKLRGHAIEWIGGEWVYCDTKEPTVSTHHERPCGHCGEHQTAEGHDACLGTLPGLMNACCGHGCDTDAYVQLLDGTAINGSDAISMIGVLKKCQND